jgi:hypothetical protein
MGWEHVIVIKIWNRHGFGCETATLLLYVALSGAIVLP